ncbi:Crp/Fnr family transcriptional regulator [Poseidonocella sp. HB161398]|uniref:Crp/Fnr family transcriptional regulator n=1 Tax=Poseidonocella sp. HB161398 TaxID=2320855 RepID=UPI0011095A34|nr:cyclic nucleotide-binding domain-containing protein [Poseidonocella sp. HB161398]
MKIAGTARRSADLASALDQVSLQGWFADCPEETRALLAPLARLQRFSPGNVVYLQGDPADGLYGLVSGGPDISVPRPDGTEFTFHRAESGFWIGDLAVMSEARRLVSVRAATEVVLLFLRAADIAALLQEHPVLYRDFYRLSYMNFSTTFFLMSNISLVSSDARVALRLLLQLERAPDPQGHVNLSQSSLAELVALSEPTLQRMRKRLSDLCCSEQAYRRIRVTDREKLLQLCGEGVNLENFR